MLVESGLYRISCYSRDGHLNFQIVVAGEELTEIETGISDDAPTAAQLRASQKIMSTIRRWERQRGNLKSATSRHRLVLRLKVLEYLTTEALVPRLKKIYCGGL